MKNAELIARLKEQCDRDAAEHCPAEIIALQAEGIAAIEALEAQLKNASVAAIAEAAEVDRLQAEVERLTTLTRGQHIELYNARLQLAAAQGQEPVMHVILDNVKTPLYAAPIPQQPVEAVHVLDTPLSEDAEKAFADFGEAYARMEMAMKDGINVHGALSSLSGCQDNLRAVLAAAPQPKETK